MNLKRPASLLPAASAALFASAVVVYAVTTTLFVYPGHLEGWQPNTVVTTASPSPAPTVEFVNGPGTPPLGTGSVELRVGSDGDNAAEMRQPNYNLTALPNPSPTPPASNELTALSYSTYAQGGGSGGQTPYLILNIDNNNDGLFNIASGDDQLFFEPVYQNGTYPTVDPSVTIPNQCGANPGCVTPGQWQTWDAFNGGWWAVSAGTFGPPLTTLRFYRQTHPNARIINSNSGLGGIRVVAGFGAGAWDDFIGNVDAFTIGVGPDTTIYDFEAAAPPAPATAGQLLISEFRYRGPGGANDEFIEIYNNTDAAHVVTASSGTGYAVVASSTTAGARCVIPNGTTIPARGHFLCANSLGYSLASYPGGAGPTTPDATYTTNIPENDGLGLFNSTTTFTAATRLDSVGTTATGDPQLREGAGLPTIVGFSIDYAWVRDFCGKGGSTTQGGACPTAGLPKDTNNNAADFYFVDTSGTAAGGGQRLGAPGPENLSSPVKRDTIAVNFIDPCVGGASPPNRVRDFTSDPANNSTFGTLDFRRTIVNNTGQPVTRLRVRIADISTFPVPAGYADLRARTSSNVVVTVDRAPCGSGTSNVTATGTVLEQPPSQPNGGGFNSTLSVPLASPLAPGAELDIRMLFGLQQTGSFKFYLNVEALP